MFMYTYNKRQRLIKRCCRILERLYRISYDLKSFGIYDEFLEVLYHMELLFPVEIKKPHGHGI